MLSTTTQHAIRALVHLSNVPNGETLLGRNLAELADIPAMRNAGMVDATRGQGGGYRLAKQANRITLMEIAELFEGVNASPGCFMGEKHPCDDENGCAAHSGWKVVCEAYAHFMTNTTIAEIGLDTGQPPSGDPILHKLSP